VNDIQRASGEGQCTVLLALDISPAFDAVEHSTLRKCAIDLCHIIGLRPPFSALWAATA